MACGCKNKQQNTGNNGVVRTSAPTTQEATPEKKGNTIIRREIR